jgi:hypothetical protein
MAVLFELVSRESFCEHVSRLALGRDEFDLNVLAGDFLSNKMKLHSYVFGTSMENWVLG